MWGCVRPSDIGPVQPTSSECARKVLPSLPEVDLRQAQQSPRRSFPGLSLRRMGKEARESATLLPQLQTFCACNFHLDSTYTHQPHTMAAPIMPFLRPLGLPKPSTIQRFMNLSFSTSSRHAAPASQAAKGTSSNASFQKVPPTNPPSHRSQHHRLPHSLSRLPTQIPHLAPPPQRIPRLTPHLLATPRTPLPNPTTIARPNHSHHPRQKPHHRAPRRVISAKPRVLRHAHTLRAAADLSAEPARWKLETDAREED